MDRTTAVRRGHELDAARLKAYLDLFSADIPGYASSQPLELSQFNAGQSNPTYLLVIGSLRLVLRKRPKEVPVCLAAIATNY